MGMLIDSIGAHASEQPFVGQSSLLEKGISENEELIAIFAKSISTARKNMGNG